MTETKPSNITTEKSSQNLLSNPTLADTFIEQIYAGVQVSELLKPNNIYQISLMSFYSQLRKPENKEFNERFTEARQIGVHTLVEKLINIYSSTDSIPDPQTIMFLKSKFSNILEENNLLIRKLYDILCSITNFNANLNCKSNKYNDLLYNISSSLLFSNHF